MTELATRRIVAAMLGATIVVATLHATPAWSRPMRGARPVQSWQDLSPNDRQRALENLQRYQRLPESGRQRMDRSYESWRGMGPGGRARVQQDDGKYRQRSPDQRRGFEDKYQRWKSGKGQ